ncbi:MAG: hypothetical protein JW932_08775 [Deltaproteobacteria bacterium]|nr:hypothetical protein [Deltaproteobacteria bacterium]
MNQEQDEKRVPFTLFPDSRLLMDYPWQIWAIGWLAILKALLWLATEPVLPETILMILFFKYLFFMVPLLVCSIGLWNLRKWGAWGMIILSVAELSFFIVYPASLRSMALDNTSFLSLVFTMGAFVLNGPISDIFILISAPVLLKHSKST